jgi:phosphoribosylanthranilate isomerase
MQALPHLAHPALADELEQVEWTEWDSADHVESEAVTRSAYRKRTPHRPASDAGTGYDPAEQEGRLGERGVQRVRVKICCIASVDELACAVHAGADAIGLVTGMRTASGRMTDADLAAIAERTPAGVSRFLLTDRLEADAILEHVERVGVDVVQVCDHVDPDVFSAVRSRSAVRVVAVVHMGAADPLGYAAQIDAVVDGLLLDSGSPGGSFESRGGTGRVHDWETSAELVRRSSSPVWLAGGLDADNVGAAIRAVQPYGVDLCSGVRLPRELGGGLDTQRLRSFMHAVAEGRGR